MAGKAEGGLEETMGALRAAGKGWKGRIVLAGSAQSRYTRQVATYRKLSFRSDTRAGFDEALSLAHYRLRLFDRDGELYGLDRKEVAEQLDRFLSAEADSECTIVLHDPTFLVQRCPRIVDLARQFAHKFQILQSDADIKHFSRGMVIVEKALVLRRPHFDHPTTFWDEDAAEVQGALLLFDEVVEKSDPAVSATVTGLGR
jgi:hypothetical protein